jgi:imidazolonepropionase-like amidohydrolase
MAAERENSRVRTRLLQGAAVAGAAGGALLAAKVSSVLAELSEPQAPYTWKPERGRTILLTKANVVDVKRAQVLKERGVLFRDGQIIDVVATRDLDKVSADRTFDCSGLFLIPGLINCHVHSMMPGAALINLPLILSVKRQTVRNMEECAIHGVTTVRDASGIAGLLGEITEMIERLEMLGPRVVGCGPALKPKGGYPEFTRKLPGFVTDRYGDACLYVNAPESGREAVRCAVEQGARFIKLFFDDRSLFYGHKPLPVIEDETVIAIVDEAHRLGRRVAVHQSQMNGFRRAVKLGVDDFEHVPIDEVFKPSDIKSFMAGDHQITPTVSVGMALGLAHPGHPALQDPLVAAMQAERERLIHELQPAFAEPAVIRSNAKMVRLYMEQKANKGMGAKSMFDPDLYLDSFANKNPNIGLLYEAGATLCCGNDGGTPMGWPGMLFVEMELLEWFGISRADILRAATINAAKLLDMESELGSVETGKLADLVLLSADPTKDIRNVERVEAVFRSGVLLHRGPAFAMHN